MSKLIFLHCATPNSPTFAFSKRIRGFRSNLQEMKNARPKGLTIFMAGDEGFAFRPQGRKVPGMSTGHPVRIPLFKSIEKVQDQKTLDFFYGCREGTVNEPAIESLHALLLQYNDIKDGLDKLSAKLADPIRSERASTMDFLL